STALPRTCKEVQKLLLLEDSWKFVELVSAISSFDWAWYLRTGYQKMTPEFRGQVAKSVSACQTNHGIRKMLLSTEFHCLKLLLKSGKKSLGTEARDATLTLLMAKSSS